jgi:N-acetylmuramoyl-L-alanine amidase
MFTKPKRKIDRVFLHCSASSKPEHGDVDVIREWHHQRGWADIGYHYFIPFNGKLQVGRDIESIPAAQKGHNTGTIAICLHGLYMHNFTLNQYETLQILCKQINIAYEDKVTFHGHSEVSNKACPVFDYKSVLELNDSGRIIGLERPKILDMFDTGVDVMNLQRRLGIFLKQHFENTDVGLAIDGVFGQDTAQAVLLFQWANVITPDGVAGPKTLLLLPTLD